MENKLITCPVAAALVATVFEAACGVYPGGYWILAFLTLLLLHAKC